MKSSKLKVNIAKLKFCSLLLIFGFCIFNFSGCVTYKFHQGEKPYQNGYVVSRDGNAIPEYTLGENDSVPAQRNVAEERFLRRRIIVEKYYKKMGYIESRYKMTFWNPFVYTGKTIKGFFRLPFIALSDYRYEHDSRYRARIQKREQQADEREEANILRLKEELSTYIREDLSGEAKVIPADPGRKEAMIRQLSDLAIENDISLGQGEALSRKHSLIIATPSKGFSPLRVGFQCRKLRQGKAKIVSYLWDFGDGDTSSKAHPVNTFYSGSFEKQYFKVTLTLRDNLGNTLSDTSTIEVHNK